MGLTTRLIAGLRLAKSGDTLRHRWAASKYWYLRLTGLATPRSITGVRADYPCEGAASSQRYEPLEAAIMIFEGGPPWTQWAAIVSAGGEQFRWSVGDHSRADN